MYWKQRKTKTWASISLRSVLIAMTLLLLTGGWIADHRHRRHRAIETLSRSGASVVTRLQRAEKLWIDSWTASAAARSTPPPRRTVEEKVFGDQIDRITASNRQLPAELVDAIGNFREVRTLNLENTDLSDNELAKLQGLGQIEDLDVSNTNITDASADFLASRTSLRSLDLAGTKIGDHTLGRLERHPNLVDLRFDRTQATEQIR